MIWVDIYQENNYCS